MSMMAPASLGSPKIMLVEDDPRLLEMLVERTVHQFDAHLTCVACGEDALDIEMVEPHDLIIAEIDLPTMDGLTLTRHLMELNNRPVILLAEEPGASHAIEAMRLGAKDLYAKPFAIDELMTAMERALTAATKRRRQQVKYQRMRRLVRRVLGERRDLNRRVELVCKDLVGAHRRLVQRVLAHEEARQTPL